LPQALEDFLVIIVIRSVFFFVSSEPAMKKSQKAASNLIQGNVKERSTDFHATGNSVSAKQESKLMAQWRSLFLSMGDILSEESSHLVSAFRSF